MVPRSSFRYSRSKCALAIIIQVAAVIAALFEILGVFLMANQIINVRTRQVPRVMLSALWQGEFAKAAELIHSLSKERVRKSLQGLAFIAFGFVISFLIMLLQLFFGSNKDGCLEAELQLQVWPVREIIS